MTDGDRGGEVGEDLDDPRSGHELREVDPVRADVTHRAQLPGPFGLEPPVPVGGLGEPVLEVATVHVPDVADLAGADALARLLHERVEADVEVRAVHETGRRREFDELRRLGGGHRERLLADDVLPGRECLLHLRMVKVVRRRQVDDVDAVVLEHRLEAVVRGREPLRRGALGGRADDSVHLDSEPAERVDVDDPDESGTHDRDAELVEAPHSTLAGVAASRLAAARVRRRTTRSVRRTCLRASAPARAASPDLIASTIGTWNSARSA